MLDLGSLRPGESVVYATTKNLARARLTTQGSEPERLAPDLDEAPNQLHPVVASFGLGIELVGGEVVQFPVPNRRERRPMNLLEFFALVIAPGNYIAICHKGQTGGMATQFFPRDRIADAVGLVFWAVKKKREVWFGLASYQTAELVSEGKWKYEGLRTQVNVQALRVFWYDADISRPGDGKEPGKAFANEAEFETWLTVFCAATGLPRPIIVNSGYGRHCYWVVEDAVSRSDWEPHAEALKAALLHHGAKGDTSITSDAARILRPPETLNFKVPNDPRPVEIVETCAEIPNELLHEKLKPFMGMTTPRAGSNYGSSNNVVSFGGAKPALAKGHTSTLNAAAQAGVEQGWFGKLTTESKNEVLRAIAALPEVIAIADTDKPAGYLNTLLAFADAEHRGATEAYEIAKGWAQTSPARYNDADFDRDWNSFDPGRPNGITIATLLGAAKKAGFDTKPWRDLANGTTTVVDQSGRRDGAVPMTAIPTRLMPEAAVNVMNRTFVFAHNWGSETLIAHRQADGRVEAIDDRQLKRSLENRRVVIQNKDKTELVPLATFWLTNQQRHEVDRVIFDPEGSRANPGEKTLNLWNGLARQPQRGRWRLMANHMFVVLCRRNRACWRYLLRWLAHCVQHPGTAPGSVIVLRSDAEGAGKSLLLNWMTWIFGEHGIFLNDPDDFIGEFNDHLENKCFISLNEPAFPGDHRAAGKLKSMITEPEWVINGKYRKRRRVSNIAHTMMTTNREWAIPAGNKARRFLMLDVDDARVGDDNYFTALRNEVDNDGIEAMLHALLHIDLTKFNPWSVPKTAALREQQLRSASTMVRWAADAARAGELVPSDPRPGLTPALPNGGFGQQVHGPTLYRAYETWCRAMRERPETHVVFGRWLSGCGVPGRRSNGASRYDVPDARAFIAAVLTKAGIV